MESLNNVGKCRKFLPTNNTAQASLMNISILHSTLVSPKNMDGFKNLPLGGQIFKPLKFALLFS